MFGCIAVISVSISSSLAIGNPLVLPGVLEPVGPAYAVTALSGV